MEDNFKEYLIKMFESDYSKGVKLTSLLNEDNYNSMEELLELVQADVKFVPELQQLHTMFEDLNSITLTNHIVKFTNYKLFQ